jgi:hypothetical protein
MPPVRCAAVPSRSCMVAACTNQHRHTFLSVNTRSLETHSPFCFTFLKGTTKSDNKLGTPLRCAVCCCSCSGCCYNTDDGRCISSLMPGGNCGSCGCVCTVGGKGDKPGVSCYCRRSCSGAGKCVVSGTEVVVNPIDIIMGEESCHRLAACPSAGGAADC